MNAPSIMDYVQALFSFFIAPLFGTVLLGMFWKRATKAGGSGDCLLGTLSSVGMYAWVKARSRGGAIRGPFPGRAGPWRRTCSAHYGAG